MILNQRVKELRMSRGLSQEIVAKQLGMSRPSYDKIENDSKELTVSQASKLASLFGVSFDRLLFETVSEAGRAYDADKYRQMILNCIHFGSSVNDHRIPKTKLAKLLYLADFSWYYKKLESMSGLQYRKWAQGPVPDEYFRIIDELFENGTISIKHSGTAQMISANEPAEDTRLSSEEKALIKTISEQWRPMRTQTIVDFTHEQLPWKICRDMELIPYELITQEEPDHVYQLPVAA
jgi:transcriptional regulator with XRE-family HTH domain